MNVRVALLLVPGIALLLFLTACGEADSPDLFTRRVQASFDVTAKVTYEVAYDAEGTGKTDPPSFTVMQGRWGRRVDSYGSREIGTYSVSLLDLGDERYICDRIAGQNPEGFALTEDQLEDLKDGVCFADESSLFDRQEMAIGPLFLFTSITETFRRYPEGPEWEAAPSRTIAGNTADCYRDTSTDPAAGEGYTEICFSDDDILLSMDIRSPESSSTFSALEVTRDVQEDDFALPYPVVDWP